MKALYQILGALIILAIVFFAGLGIGFKRCYNGIVTQDSVVVKYDSSKVIVEVPVEVIKTEYVGIPADIDSAAVFIDYFTRYYYELNVDTNEVRITGIATVYQNKLQPLTLSVENLRPTAITYNTINAPANHIAVGLMGGYDLVAPGVFYRHKKTEVGVSYNLISDSPQKLIFSAKHDLFNWK